MPSTRLGPKTSTPTMCSSVYFGGKPVEIASTTEDAHVRFSAPLSLLILTAEKENKHAGLMEKNALLKKIN